MARNQNIVTRLSLFSKYKKRFMIILTYQKSFEKGDDSVINQYKVTLFEKGIYKYLKKTCIRQHDDHASWSKIYNAYQSTYANHF